MQQQTADHHADPVVGYSLHNRRYLNVTNRCTLRCAFCPKFNKTWEVQGYPLRLYQEPTVEQMLDAVGDPKDYEAVVFCGLGEPTLRLDAVLSVARQLKARGAPAIRINTDGLASLVHGRDVTPEMAGCIDALSVSLNAQDAFTYERHCRPKLPGAYPALLDFVRAARVHVPEVTVTAVDGLPGVDITACEAIARELGVGFRRRVLDLVG
ncbi:TatD family nuclease-associated radical SAM protein [Ectothiorhodospira shaposhnikovii]|uniref:TatD family nuclease-associated radical SAM protein n=1 Tax=Ectothiorhodospira shaposhnikovii TaxID=1054 RepID=UPI001905D215|nr:TatD family nuclease-associated radical SAM protein [Ectothiorhodospira shaposhnikovii]MBK1673715.1 radical SAM protein [Ectothiorhodospira shaposhnikovii]